jgi:hypothetical protein
MFAPDSLIAPRYKGLTLPSGAFLGEKPLSAICYWAGPFHNRLTVKIVHEHRAGRPVRLPTFINRVLSHIENTCTYTIWLFSLPAAPWRS